MSMECAGFCINSILRDLCPRYVGGGSVSVGCIHVGLRILRRKYIAVSNIQRIWEATHLESFFLITKRKMFSVCLCDSLLII